MARRVGLSGFGRGRELEENAVVEEQYEATAARVFDGDRSFG
jgi:hypothetical protein